VKPESVPISAIYFSRHIAMSAKEPSSKDPDNFSYTQLWASSDGETHLEECRMTGFDLKKYAEDVQFVKEGPEPAKVVFTVGSPDLRDEELRACKPLFWPWIVCDRSCNLPFNASFTASYLALAIPISTSSVVACPSQRQEKKTSTCAPAT
jgi:hypothetical protein